MRKVCGSFGRRGPECVTWFGWALTGGVVATLVIGALAGLYPAVRASAYHQPRHSRRPSGHQALINCRRPPAATLNPARSEPANGR